MCVYLICLLEVVNILSFRAFKLCDHLAERCRMTELWYKALSTRQYVC